MHQIPLRTTHESLGAKMVPFAGFNMPVRYSSDIDEHLCVRNKVVVFDVSHMGEFWVKGPDAFAFVQNLVTNDVSKLSDGQAQYAVMVNEAGFSLDDLLVYKFETEKYMLVVNAGNLDKDWAWVQQQAKGYTHLELENASADMCLFAVQGPKAIATLQKLTEIDLSAIPYYSFVEGDMATKNCIISATGYTGSGGFEIYTSNADALTVFMAILDAGQEFGIQPIGLGARDTLRLEMGYCLYGHELDEATTPLEAGLGWVTKLAKEAFIGKAALVAQKEAGLQKKLVGFTIEGKGGIPRAGYTLHLTDGTQVGIVTSGSISPCLGIGFGLAFVAPASAALGTALQLKVRDRMFPASIVKLPLPVLNQA